MRDYLFDAPPELTIETVQSWEQLVAVPVTNDDTGPCRLAGPAVAEHRQGEYVDSRTGFTHQRCGGGTRVFRK